MDGTGLTRTTPSREVYVPRVARVRSTPVVDTLHVRLLHGQTPEELAQAAEGLRHVFQAHRCKVVEDAPGRVRVVFYAHDPLTRTITPMDPAAVPDLGGLPVGLSEDGEPYRLRLRGRHILVAGASDSGKGSVLWSLVRALAPGVVAGTVELHGIDPKRMELVFAPTCLRAWSSVTRWAWSNFWRTTSPGCRSGRTGSPASLGITSRPSRTRPWSRAAACISSRLVNARPRQNESRM